MNDFSFKRIAYYLYYLFVDFFFWLIFLTIATSFFGEKLGGVLGFFSFFYLFSLAKKQTENKMKENNKDKLEALSKFRDEYDRNSGISISFTTSYGGRYNDQDYEEAKKASWYGNDAEIEIQGFKISSPLIYISQSGLKSPACHIVPDKLKVSKEENYDQIGYWPSYSELNPNQRGMFLRWLSTGKNEPSIDIGYVFIYFYGLEYRILVDNVDFEIIANELIRLRKIYNSNHSFRRYSEGLFAYILANLENKSLAQGLFKEVEPTIDKYSCIYTSGINLLIKDTIKLSEDEVISSISSFEGVPRSSIPYKVGKNFDEYFKMIAKEEIHEAIEAIKPKEFNQSYYSASNFVRNTKSYKGLRVVVSRNIQGKLGKKWIQAIDAFRPYSRKLTKCKPNEIFNLLPTELRLKLDHPLKENLKIIESELLNKVVPLSSVATALGFSKSEKFSSKECSEIVETLLSSSLIIEPDLSYFKKTYNSNENVIVSKSNNPDKLDFDDYKLAALMTDFGVDLAYSDGNFSDSEAEQIYSFVTQNYLKKEIEKEHLKLRILLHKEVKPKMNGVFKKLSERLGLNELKVLSDYLVQVAIADGVFTKDEDKKIRTSLSKLGLENSYIKDLYSKFGIKEISDNVDLKAGATGPMKGSFIPRDGEEEFSIDKDKLEQLAADTKKVKSVLSTIITIDDDEIEEIVTKVETDVEEKITLDEKHSLFLKELISQHEWSKNDLREKAKEMGLMVNAAISKINEWADELYGDYLIFEDEKYYIQDEVLKEVKDCA